MSPGDKADESYYRNVAQELVHRAGFGDRKARVFRAPGRVNVIGEHTDYNDGFVFPVAIRYSTWVAAALREDSKVTAYSENLGESREWNLDDPATRRRNDWSDYVAGVMVVCREAGSPIRGADLRIHGEVPIGSGLSSSAALETSVAFALLSLANAGLDRTKIAQLCQKAENEFVGMRCGIMDQFVACHAQAGKALLLDCRSLEYQLASLPGGTSLAICNTMVHHELAASAYNERRAECEAGVRLLAARLPGIRALRDVSIQQLEQYGRDMPSNVYKRCRHVIAENRRVEDAFAALNRGDLQSLGALMAQSHRSLRDDYEVSCRELDCMVEIASALTGVHGSRMTGGGFGGCTVNLVAEERVDEFQLVVSERYQEATGKRPAIYVSDAADGAGEIALG